ncbi:MAG: organic hydroperoxide resistance protein [Bacteroidales bacterium]|jgi:Ohr subfamily peroxiredoxin|nr:organic hydroperoxide resistance protein [Bacteroidales bacterium]MDD4218061.1 organic hydroperoxide resistance protein [Bacteroidales bacterium]MDY0142610.1 organic hydroperoxide resistance protein [Bacteroidales bacterium]
MERLYTAKVTASGGRNGHVKSDDGVIDMDVRMPKGLGGDGGEYANPESLFGATYSACYDGALNLVAKMAKHRIESTTTANVTIGKESDGGLAIAVQLDIEVKGVDRKIAQDLVNQAHQVCPYSKAIRNNVEVILNLI